MYKIGKYKESDLMNKLICENYNMLLVMSRFGIPLGFGDKSIREVCRENEVDVRTFLEVVNFLICEEKEGYTSDNELSISSLLQYLKRSHSYFLDFRLPSIRRKLIETIDCAGNDIALVLIKYFDEYVAEVRKHMGYEERIVFPYSENVISDNVSDKYNIEVFRKQHDKVEIKLRELKDIIIKYYPAKSSNELNGVLFDIFSCAEDLASHNDIENGLFVPAIQRLETERKNR